MERKNQESKRWFSIPDKLIELCLKKGENNGRRKWSTKSRKENQRT